jgi:tetratricopeptide (TPR) repeat protein
MNKLHTSKETKQTRIAVIIRFAAPLALIFLLGAAMSPDSGGGCATKRGVVSQTETTNPPKHFLADDVAAFADFQEKARAWRQQPVKPPLSEEVRRFRVLAEDALQSKNFEKAAGYYEKGLTIEPMWPAGQFDAALLYAELQKYAQAVLHMKRYLELNPDDKDARNLRDKMYVWEEKANETNLPSEDNSSTQPAKPDKVKMKK